MREGHTETSPEGEELVAADGDGEVGDGEEHIVAARLVQAEDVAVGVGAVVERRDEVLQRGAGVVCELGEEDLGLFLGEGAHCGCGVGVRLERRCEEVVSVRSEVLLGLSSAPGSTVVVVSFQWS